MEPNTQNNLPTSQPKKALPGKLLVVLVLAVILVGGGIVLFAKKPKNETPAQNNSTESTNTANDSANKVGALSLEPTEGTVTTGKDLTFVVWVDSKDVPVNAVQANLNYPADKFDFVSIDSSGSAFTIQAEATGGDGKVSVARGQVGGVTGKQLVAKVTLRAKTTGGNADISFSNDSAVISATDNKNVLNNSSGAQFSVETE